MSQLEDANANRDESDAIPYYKNIALKEKEKNEALTQKIMRLENHIASQDKVYEKKMKDKEDDWRVLFAWSDDQRKEYDQLKSK